MVRERFCIGSREKEEVMAKSKTESVGRAIRDMKLVKPVMTNTEKAMSNTARGKKSHSAVALQLHESSLKFRRRHRRGNAAMGGLG